MEMEKSDDDDGEARLLLRLLQLPMQMSMAMLVLRINSARFLSHRARIWPFGELGDAGYTVSFGMFDQGIG